MLRRYLIIGVISFSVVLLVAAIIAANTNPRGNQGTNALAESKANIQTAVSQNDVNSAPVPGTNSAKAVLDVQGMSCSGCIYTIKSSLAGFEGIRDVLVDLNSGRVEVFYDSTKVSNLEPIASAITAAGYPATVKQTMTGDEIEKENTLFATRSKLYIASVGDWEISREDFETELSQARNRYQKVYGNEVFAGDQGNALLQRLQSQVASNLISEGIQMQEVRKSGFGLSKQTVEQEFQAFLSKKGVSPEKFQQALNESSYNFDYFLKKFENRLTIDRYIEEVVLSGISNELEKQQQYSDWYNNARLLAKVVYYDKNLENIAKTSTGGSGCGSSCTRQ